VALSQVPSRHATSIIFDPVPNYVENKPFTLSGTLVDISTGKELPSKIIILEGNGIPSLTTTRTNGLIIEDNKQAQVVYCSSCVNPDSEESTPGSKILHLNIGGKILMTDLVKGVTLAVQDIGISTFTVDVVRQDGSVYSASSTGMSPDITDLSLLSPTGIKELILRSVGENSDTGYLGISSIKIFDPERNLELQHTFEFDEIPLGPVTEVIHPGFFLSDTISPSQAAREVDGKMAIEVIATFAGDRTYEASHNVALIELNESDNGKNAYGFTDNYGSIYDYVGTDYATITCSTDADGDGICDAWETSGIPYTNSLGGTSYYDLCSGDGICPSLNHKDIFVELDYMQYHLPKTESLDKVKTAFANAPVSNPDSVNGTTIHFKVDNQVTHVQNINTWKDPVTSPGYVYDTNYDNDYVSIKKLFFGTSTERTVTVGSSTDVITDSTLSPSDTIVKYENRAIKVSTTAASQGKITILTGVIFSSNPGTMTVNSVTITGSHASLQVGTPTATIITPDPSTYPGARLVTVKVPISPDSSVSNLDLGTIKVELKASTAPTGTITLTQIRSTGPFASTTLLDAKAWAYHYGLFAHSFSSGCSPAGFSEAPGNDLIVSLGCNFHDNVPGHTSPDGSVYTVGSIEEQAGTLMHELGHNLKLHHGGPMTGVSSTNYLMQCKPNYISVMNTVRMIPYFLDNATWNAEALDYSRAALSTLTENSLSEPAGLSSPTTKKIVYGTPGHTPAVRAVNTGPNIDWNGDGSVSGTVSADINNLGISGCGASSGQTLTSYNDWNNIVFNFRPTMGSYDGFLPPFNADHRDVTGAMVHGIQETALPATGVAQSNPGDPSDNLSIVIAIGVVALAVSALFYFRSRGNEIKLQNDLRI
jgi:hypothetical protein